MKREGSERGAGDPERKGSEKGWGTLKGGKGVRDTERADSQKV